MQERREEVATAYVKRVYQRFFSYAVVLPLSSASLSLSFSFLHVHMYRCRRFTLPRCPRQRLPVCLFQCPHSHLRHLLLCLFRLLWRLRMRLPFTQLQCHRHCPRHLPLGCLRHLLRCLHLPPDCPLYCHPPRTTPLARTIPLYRRLLTRRLCLRCNRSLCPPRTLRSLYLRLPCLPCGHRISLLWLLLNLPSLPLSCRCRCPLLCPQLNPPSTPRNRQRHLLG